MTFNRNYNFSKDKFHFYRRNKQKILNENVNAFNRIALNCMQFEENFTNNFHVQKISEIKFSMTDMTIFISRTWIFVIFFWVGNAMIYDKI